METRLQKLNLDADGLQRPRQQSNRRSDKASDNKLDHIKSNDNSDNAFPKAHCDAEVNKVTEELGSTGKNDVIVDVMSLGGSSGSCESTEQTDCQVKLKVRAYSHQ